MPKVAQAGEFFVVGGPVQPDRACYVTRAADADLARGIAEQRFCYVLAARSTGKSSLMARAIRDLRRDGQLAAVVDLSQIGVRGESGDAARWYYGIAYRVLRELRLKVDLQGWWQEKSALSGEQRLAEFFSDIVLAHTSVSVTVLIDEIERTLSLPFVQDLFATIHACYAWRVSEPEYARLNFVVLGVASPAALCPDPGVSPFIDGLAVDPADFTLEQSLELAAGFDAQADDGRELMKRIHAWSGGQPYLTQRIGRSVARKGGRLADVDRVVREQFLAPGAAEKDPYLNRIRMQLTQSGPRPRRALALLAKIARGAAVPDDSSSPPQELLRLTGVTVRGADGSLHYRNRLLRQVFDDRWISSVRPFDFRRAGAVAALLAVAVLVPIWYSQVLPRPYIRTLSVVTQDFAVAQDAYEKLHRLPGFAGTADRLLAEAMTRRSRDARTYEEMIAADRVLRRLPEQSELADRLAADFWLRQAAAAMHEERRDEALLLAARAADTDGGPARAAAAELIGADYPALVGTFRFSNAPLRWAVDWDAGELAVVDGSHRVRRLAMSPAAASAPTMPSQRLTSLLHVPVQREIGVDEPGTAGEFRLLARIGHDRPEDVSLALTAPSGDIVRLQLDARESAGGRYEFTADAGRPLAALAGVGRAGVWRLTLVDRRSGASGTLVDWALAFPGAGHEWRDAPEQGLSIPDPVPTEQVEVSISVDGRFAAAYPSRTGAVGGLAVWDLVHGRALHHLDPPGRPDFVAFGADASRLLVQVGDRVALWDVDAGQRIASIEADGGLALEPSISGDGGYVALAEQGGDGDARLKLVRAKDGAVTAVGDGIAGARAWVLGPEARYAAAIDSSGRSVIVVDPRRSTPARTLRHEHDVVRLIPAPAGNLLLSVDALGDVRAWSMAIGTADAGGDEGHRVGTTADADSVSVSADGTLVAFEGRHAQVVVSSVAGDTAQVRLRTEPGAARAATRIAPDGRTLVTASAGRFRLWRIDAMRPIEHADPNLSALALDDGGAVAALGFRGGHVRVRSVSELARPGPRGDAIDYIGHRGRVTALDIDASRALIASGGANGVVRIWDLASVSPTPHFMRHPSGPVQAVELSPDGRWVASASEYFARVWRVRDGALVGEQTVNGTALAIAFSHDASRWAVGDSAGNVFVSLTGDAAPIGSVRAQGPVGAIAFAEDGLIFASGDETGHVELWDAATFSPIGPRRRFAYPVRWLAFTGADAALLIQTDAWLHRAEISDGRIHVVASRLLPFDTAAGAAAVSGEGLPVRLVGGLGGGPVAFHEVLLDASPGPPRPDISALLERDWSAVLGIEIGDDGEVVEIEL